MTWFPRFVWLGLHKVIYYLHIVIQTILYVKYFLHEKAENRATRGIIRLNIQRLSSGTLQSV